MSNMIVRCVDTTHDGVTIRGPETTAREQG